MQVIQDYLTREKLKNKYYDLNRSTSSELLPGHTSGWTIPETRGQGSLWTWTIRSTFLSMVQGGEGDKGIWRGKWEKSSTAVIISSALSGTSLSITSDPSEIPESDISRPEFRPSDYSSLSLSLFFSPCLNCSIIMLAPCLLLQNVLSLWWERAENMEMNKIKIVSSLLELFWRQGSA